MAKGDADKLKADIDDGYMRLSNLLTEALCAADLTACELKTVLFIARRTYGWARGRDHAYKADSISAQEVSTATGEPLSTVRHALRSLRRSRILLRVGGEPGYASVYGINSNIAEWGAGEASWDRYRERLKMARESGVFSRSNAVETGTDPFATQTPCLPADTLPTSGHPVGAQTLPLSAHGHPPCPPTDTPPVCGQTGLQAENGSTVRVLGSLQTDYRQYTENGTAPPVGDAPETPPEPPAPLPTPAPKAKAKRERPAEDDTPEQAVIRTAWEAHGFDGPPGGKGYSGLVKLVQEHGIPRIAQWAEHVRGDPPELPEGAEPHAWFAVQFRAAMARPWEWDGSRRPGGRSNGEAWILASDGTRWYERDWDPFDNLAAKLTQIKSSGNWIEARGVTKRPHPGFVCVDGWMYDSMGNRKNEVVVP